MAYERMAEISGWRVVRHSVSRTLYVSWYDAGARQVRRSSLKTRDLAAAVERVRAFADSGFDDPRDFSDQPQVSTVREVLDLHRDRVAKKPSAAIELLNIDLLQSCGLADRRLASLRLRDFEALRDEWLQAGASVATVSRRLSTLRSAIRQAALNREIRPEARIHVPEFRTKNVIRSAPLKGRVCTVDELASLYQAARAPHLRLALFLLFCTAARVGALLDLTADQLLPDACLIDLNPQGRVQTNKYRPVLPMTRQLAGWAPKLKGFRGPLITYHGSQVRSLKTAMRAAVTEASLDRRVNTYSVRHTIGRHLRRCGVATEEIAVWMGHVAPPDSPETTLVYSPFELGYGQDARIAIEGLVDEIGKKAGVDFTEMPASLVHHMQGERSGQDSGAAGRRALPYMQQGKACRDEH